MKPLIVAITGASGVVYGIRFVKALLSSCVPVELVISDSGRLVIREELGITFHHAHQHETYTEIFGSGYSNYLKVHSAKDFTAPIASGSYPTAGMAIIPCSMGTLGAITSGISQNLIHRAADCTLKEGRRLLLLPRETPLNAIHLENMLKLARLGVKIVPAMPGFYSGAKNLDDMIDFMVGKVLDQFDIPHMLYPRWVGAHGAK